MSEEIRRSQMLELRDLLTEVGRLSDAIAELRAGDSFDEQKLRNLETERDAVSTRAHRLRALIDEHDKTPAPG